MMMTHSSSFPLHRSSFLPLEILNQLNGNPREGEREKLVEREQNRTERTKQRKGNKCVSSPFKLIKIVMRHPITILVFLSVLLSLSLSLFTHLFFLSKCSHPSLFYILKTLSSLLQSIWHSLKCKAFSKSSICFEKWRGKSIHRNSENMEKREKQRKRNEGGSIDFANNSNIFEKRGVNVYQEYTFTRYSFFILSLFVSR